MRRTWRSFRSFDLPVQLLLVNQLGVNVGFFMLVPFLSAYLTDGLGLAAVTVGLVLGVRTLSQQGLFLLGGSAADRLGARPVILLGCGLRAVGFGLFAVVDSLPGLIAAAVLSGVAGALFSPAVRAYVSLDAGERRAEAFSLFNVFANVGSLLGPLLGTLLLGVGFAWVAGTAAAIFAALTIAQTLALPDRRMARLGSDSLLSEWRSALTNRRFAGLALTSGGLLTLYSQLYLALPLEAQRVTGSGSSVAAIFLVSAVVTIACQVRVTDWCRAHLLPGQAITVGLALTGLAFAPLIVLAPLQPAVEATPGLAQTLWSATPVLVATAVLSLGVAVAQPFTYDLVPVLGSRELTGTYFGVLYLCAGLMNALGNTGTGQALDLAAAHDVRWLPWVGLTAVGLLCAAGAAALQRTGRFEPAALTHTC